MAKRSASVDAPTAATRGVRAASRRTTPTPQLSKVAPQPARGTRAMRSASRDFEFVDAQKPTRRSARQASVTSITSVAGESDNDGLKPHKTRRRPAKEASGDLTMVEETDTQLALDLAPATPTRIDLDDSAPFRSPGANSEMSGTTAISSFSMIEAEFLEPKFMLKHMPKLCEAANEFLEHIAPSSGDLGVDLRNIQEIQKPDSDFTEEYRDFDVELHVHLKHFKGEEYNYIHTRAIHRALLGLNSDAVAAQTGMDLVFYLTNVLVFAKQMIHSDRSEKVVWDALRQLDNSFPSHFMPSLVSGSQPTFAGESALFAETFNLALDLRTQLAILVLQRANQDAPSDPFEELSEVFMHGGSSQDDEAPGLRGWYVSALGGETALPREFHGRVIERLRAIQKFFPQDTQTLETVDLEELGSTFPWEATVLRLLGWARLRHRELRQTIEEMGGAKEILKRVKSEMEKPRSSTENTNAAPASRQSPRKKRTSFGRDRRRSSRKFDPNAPVDIHTIDALKARENESGVLFEIEALRPAHDAPATQPTAEENQISEAIPDNQQEDDWQATLGDDLEQPDATLVGEPTLIGEPEEDVGKTNPSGPPSNPADMLKVLKAHTRPEKENRNVSIFNRQTNAQRVEFGDGFDDSQPTPGPSNPIKGKTRADTVPSKKRAREDDDESEDDAFDSHVRTASDEHVRERRVKAPVAKKIRLDPASSGVPPSHQPSRLPASQVEEPEQEESLSEKEAPEMTEYVPDATEAAAPPSTFQDVRQLAVENAVENSAYQRRRRERQPRRQWSAAAEEALASYMERFPQQYSNILKADKKEDNMLQEWSQVNLKDKVRNMAVAMIKSGTGIRVGFEDVVKPTDKMGKKLIEEGYWSP